MVIIVGAVFKIRENIIWVPQIGTFKLVVRWIVDQEILEKYPDLYQSLYEGIQIFPSIDFSDLESGAFQALSEATSGAYFQTLDCWEEIPFNKQDFFYYLNFSLLKLFMRQDPRIQNNDNKLITCQINDNSKITLPIWVLDFVTENAQIWMNLNESNIDKGQNVIDVFRENNLDINKTEKDIVKLTSEYINNLHQRLNKHTSFMENFSTIELIPLIKQLNEIFQTIYQENK